MSDVHRALLSCPDITSLDLRIDLLGCSEWPDRWDLPFSLHGGESYPPLKSLRLEGYRFSDNSLHEAKFPTSPMLSWCERAREWIMSGNAFKRLCQYTLTQQQRGKINLDLWRDAMDFSRLEDLAFAADYKPSDVAFFLDRMATHLQGLKRLHLDGTTSNSTLGFLRDLNSSLTHLTVTNMDILDTGIAVKIIDPDTNTKLLASVVKSHGHSLQHLGIHTFENLDYNTPIIPAEELTTNLPKLPSLTHLTLNIRRNGTWPFEALATIASSTPNLTTLDLYLDIASVCRHQKPDISPGSIGWDTQHCKPTAQAHSSTSYRISTRPQPSKYSNSCASTRQEVPCRTLHSGVESGLDGGMDRCIFRNGWTAKKC
ncbi:hypothetical protein LTR10_013328 [Elasticomyces elasticus]|nr:hypothetical protein LTR10_013328 [Elasticomyces elasticus]